MVHIHGQTYGCTRFTVYKDVGEDRSARDIEPGGDQKPAGDCHRLDGLVDGAGADALHVDGDAIFDHAGYSACHRGGR